MHPLRERQPLAVPLPSEGMDRRLAESTSDLLTVLDAEARILWASASWRALMGHDPEQLVGQPGFTLVHPDDARMAQESLAGLMAAGHGRALVRMRHADGSWRWHDVVAFQVADGGDDRTVTMARDVTEQKEATDRLRALMLQSPISTQILRPDGRTAEANPAFYQLWGIAPDALRDYNLLHDEQLDRKGVLPLVRRAFAGETVRIPPIRYDPAETGQPGRARWVRAVAYPVKGMHGEVREVVIQHEDVTEQTEALAAVRESEANFRTLFEALPLGVALLAPGGRTVAVNAALCGMLGYTREELLRRSLSDATHPEERGGDHDIAARMRRGEAPEGSFEGRCVRRDGTTIWVRLSSRPVPAEDGAPRFVLSTIEDVTARRRAQHERNLLAAIVESSDDAIVSKDLDGTVTSWNRGAERMFGYTAEEALGKPLLHLIIPPGMEAEEQDILRRIASGERLDHFETKRRRKDGSLVDVSVTVSPVRDASGRITGASKVARDIGGRKQIEQAMKDTEDARSRLVNMAAHELKTPMTPLKLQIVLLKAWEHNLNERQRAALAVLERNVDRLDRLVDDVLDATRLQAGRLRLDVAPIDLNEVIADALGAFEEVARESGVALEAGLGPPAVVRGDPRRLAQVMFNLLANALKATPAGGAIRVETAREGGEATVRVQDTGIGLSAKDLASLFQPFSQVEHARGEVGRLGSGLGLFICKGIVEQHGGRIVAESPGQGHGATFTFALPLTDEPPVALRAREGRDVARKSVETRLREAL